MVNEGETHYLRDFWILSIHRFYKDRTIENVSWEETVHLVQTVHNLKTIPNEREQFITSAAIQK